VRIVTDLSIPRFGELLGPYIARVAPETMPRFLALLERGAADRYRRWADQLPEHREGLLRCADSEDEIADHIDGAFDLDESLREQLVAPLPEALQTYYEVFAPLPIWDQLRIQADAERQGAAAWRGIASRHPDPAVIDVLETCSRLEEASADFLDELIASHAP
jgi:hypothetical protein